MKNSPLYFSKNVCSLQQNYYICIVIKTRYYVFKTTIQKDRVFNRPTSQM